MNKIRFANDTEMEVSGVTQAGDTRLLLSSAITLQPPL